MGRVTVLPSVWDMKTGECFILILYGIVVVVVVVGSVEEKEQCTAGSQSEDEKTSMRTHECQPPTGEYQGIHSRSDDVFTQRVDVVGVGLSLYTYISIHRTGCEAATQRPSVRLACVRHLPRHILRQK